MENRIITIENGIVHIPQSVDIWMTQHEIANLFQCFVSKINANIRAILKTEVLHKSDVCRIYSYDNGSCVEQYNLEMITALSFRIKSRNAKVFRDWMLGKATAKTSKMQILMVGNRNSCYNN